MSDKEMTYRNVRFHKSSSELQNVGRPDETQEPTEAGHRKYSISWHLIAITLGMLSFILLVGAAVLVNHIFQYNKEKHELQETQSNIHQEYSTMQKESYLCEEKLRNKSIEYNVLKDYLDSFNGILNRGFLETKLVLDCQRHTGKVIEVNVFCCGIKCYYLTKDKKNWWDCHQTCQDCNLSLLKIDDDHELKFLQLQMKQATYWIGLSYNISKKKWQWSDGQPPKLDLSMTNVNHSTRKCAILSKTRLQDDDCEKCYSYICERRMDKFFDSPSSNSLTTDKYSSIMLRPAFHTLKCYLENLCGKEVLLKYP